MALAEELYGRLYIRPSFPQPPSRADVLAQRDFIADLSTANNGRGTWEPGWTLRRIAADGHAVAGKNGVEFRLHASGWRGLAIGEIGRAIPARSQFPKSGAT